MIETGFSTARTHKRSECGSLLFPQAARIGVEPNHPGASVGGASRRGPQRIIAIPADRSSGEPENAAGDPFGARCSHAVADHAVSRPVCNLAAIVAVASVVRRTSLEPFAFRATPFAVPPWKGPGRETRMSARRTTAGCASRTSARPRIAARPASASPARCGRSDQSPPGRRIASPRPRIRGRFHRHRRRGSRTSCVLSLRRILVLYPP